MADIMIGDIRTEVTVTDTDALLHPAILEKIIAAVEARLAEKTRAAAARHAETRIGAGQ